MHHKVSYHLSREHHHYYQYLFGEVRRRKPTKSPPNFTIKGDINSNPKNNQMTNANRPYVEKVGLHFD